MQNAGQSLADLFGMWAGASFQIEYFVYGVILMTFFGLDFAQVVFVTIVGEPLVLAPWFDELAGARCRYDINDDQPCELRAPSDHG